MENADKAGIFHWCHFSPRSEVSTIEFGSEETNSMVSASSPKARCEHRVYTSKCKLNVNRKKGSNIFLTSCQKCIRKDVSFVALLPCLELQKFAEVRPDVSS